MSLLRSGNVPCRYFFTVSVNFKIMQCRMSNLRKGSVALSNLRVKGPLFYIAVSGNNPSTHCHCVNGGRRGCLLMSLGCYRTDKNCQHVCLLISFFYFSANNVFGECPSRYLLYFLLSKKGHLQTGGCFSRRSTFIR